MHLEDIKSLNTDIFRVFDCDWALLTAGTMDDFNAMTISWGQLGSLWGMPGKAKNTVTVFVKPVRHTFSYMMHQDIFTVCWFPAACRRDLGILGSKSGRDGNKLALTQLTPRSAGGGVGYDQASLTLVCRKLYFDQLEKTRIPADVTATFYSGTDGVEPHYMFIGEVTSMMRRA